MLHLPKPSDMKWPTMVGAIARLNLSHERFLVRTTGAIYFLSLLGIMGAMLGLVGVAVRAPDGYGFS